MRTVVAILALAFVFDASASSMGVLRKPSELEFKALPGLPTCITQAVESGDPNTGPAILIFKATAGCAVPRHWHTPTENVLIVSGTAKFTMVHEGTSVVLGAGGYAKMPSKHVHEFVCTSACTGFVVSDGAFDIHFVDKEGKEIPPEVALGGKKK